MFWKLFKESTIMQALLAVMYSGAIIYLLIEGRAVPELLINVLMLIVGFYFGTKVPYASAQKE